MDKKWKNAGTTLVELLVVLALVSIVLSGLISVYLTGHNAFERESADSDIQYAARMAMNEITTDVLQAREIKILDSGTELQIDDTIKYYLKDGQLLRSGVPIAENIAYINFRGSYKLVMVTLEAKLNNEKYRLASSITPRIYTGPVDTGPARLVATDYQGNIYISEDGITWTIVSQTDNPANDVTWNGSMFVVVGEGEIRTSTDGVNWSIMETDYNLNAVTWGYDYFVAAGDHGTILISSDGLNWIKKAGQAGGINLNDVIWGDNGFIIVGDNKTVHLSLDGDDWTKVNVSGHATNWNGVAWGKDKYVAVGAGGIIHWSSNGADKSWEEVNSGVTTNLNNITWGNNKFVAVGASGTILTSPDGKSSWSKVPQNQILDKQNNLFNTQGVDFMKVIWSQDMFIAVGERNINGVIDGVTLTSTDGSTWIVNIVIPGLVSVTSSD